MYKYVASYLLLYSVCMFVVVDNLTGQYYSMYIILCHILYMYNNSMNLIDLVLVIIKVH